MPINWLCLRSNVDILLANLVKPEQTDFDMTCDVSNDLQVKCFTLFEKFMHRAIEWRLNFGNQSLVIWETRGDRHAPPPHNQQNV